MITLCGDDSESQVLFPAVNGLSQGIVRRDPAVVATDLNLADDISLLSDSTEKVQELLHSVERECKRTGLTLNAKKIRVMFFNKQDTTIKTIDGEAVRDFKYIGAWMASTSRQRHEGPELKSRLFVATVQSVLLYGLETWTITITQEG